MYFLDAEILIAAESRTSTLTDFVGQAQNKQCGGGVLFGVHEECSILTAAKTGLLQHGSKHLTGLFNGLYTCDFQTNFVLLQDYIGQTSNQAISFSTSFARTTTPQLGGRRHGLGSEQTNLHSSETKTGKSHQNCWVSFSNDAFFSRLGGKLVDPFPGWTQPSRVVFAVLSSVKINKFSKAIIVISFVSCRNTRSSCEISISHICRGNNMGKWVV